jgi:hypothetical protein
MVCFNGRVNGNQAVMTGKITFAGDTRKAISMRRFFNIMNKSYQQALTEVGDLSQMSKFIQPQPLATTPVSQVSAPLAVSTTGDIRPEILQVMADFSPKVLSQPLAGISVHQATAIQRKSGLQPVRSIKVTLELI